MPTNSLSGKVYYGPRYGGDVINPGTPPSQPAKASGFIVNRTPGPRQVFVAQNASQVGAVTQTGTTPSRYPRRMPSGYITTRSQAQANQGQ